MIRAWLEALAGYAAIAAICLAIAGWAAGARGQSCGVPPLPPLPLPGCATMDPVCICDWYRCRWGFICRP